MKVTLNTDRLILRPFNMFDSEKMFLNWASDHEVTKYLTWNAHENIEQTKKIIALWIEQYNKEERINFAITLQENNELIGGIDVVGYLDGIPVIGYVLSKAYWNNGYVTEACKAVIDFLFTLGHEKIIIDAFVENIASNKVILKCGGRFIETYHERIESENKTVLINRYYIEKSKVI